MEISEEKKLEILLAQLQERYEALHKMRDRSMQFALWILGLGLGMAWLLINEAELSSTQRLFLTIFLIVVGLTVWFFIHAIACGFKANREIIIRIEKALKLYEGDCYGISEPILPSKFSNQRCGKTGHFSTLYILIIVVFITLIVLTWTNPCKVNSTKTCISEPNQMQIKAVNK